VTGVTGFLGAHLLSEILRRSVPPKSAAKVYCLVRAKSIEDGLQRIKDKFSFYKLKWKSRYDTAVVPVCPFSLRSPRYRLSAHFLTAQVLGDLLLPDFGLRPEAFSSLSTSIDVIYHCGAWVNGIYDFETLKVANVGSVVSILKLASPNNALINHISTVSVITDRDPFVPAPESPVAFKSAPNYANGYAYETQIQFSPFSLTA